MDAQAYLLRHGWSGPGNPLNPNRRPGAHGGLGLTKPILVARRKGNLGVGKQTTKDPTNQWWLRGFEDALKGVGDENSAGTDKKPNALTSELYRHFVRGEVVPGTLSGDRKKEDKGLGELGSGSRPETKKRKKDDGEGEDREAKKLRKEERKRRKMEKVGSGEDSVALQSDSKDRKETKEERRQRKEEKRRKKEEKEGKKKKNTAGAEDSSGTDGNEESSPRKSKKMTGKYNPEEDYPTPVSMDNDQTESSGRDESSETIEKSKRKKEKKEKKEKAKDKESEMRKKSEESTPENGSKSKSKKLKDAKKSSKD
ncbi:hypothetical protein BDV28DRAFT_132521 [Aspergillus coremiiformis]|uniref:Protein TMA23 n=1 Tax=Aspergillus coremiiformis TaxID=138285 RepID=A0A5N6Z8M2_9EURO|nr:hypothetical protein BDV28DRAFT_132521 [Aspergillus coremiiformis]